MSKPVYYQLLRNWAVALSQLLPRPALIYLPRYLLDWRRLSSMGCEVHFRDSYPCLTDRLRHTPFDPHYFYQAGWLARRLAAVRPDKHVDIGSDVRMINVLSAFVPTEFLDYRPLQVDLSGLICGSDDLVALSRPDKSIFSLSCLHVIEHIGLGRYSDPLDPDGSRKAASELSRVLARGGRLYISVPVGRERVCFNAHRVFDPDGFTTFFPGLALEAFSYVDDAGQFHEAGALVDARHNEYACGLYIFTRH